MWHGGKNPLKRVKRDSEDVVSPKGMKQRRLHKAFLRYHDANNWPLLRQALKDMGRADLIGNGKRHLIPTYQPAGTGNAPEGARRKKTGQKQQVFRTQRTMADRPVRKSPAVAAVRRRQAEAARSCQGACGSAGGSLRTTRQPRCPPTKRCHNRQTDRTVCRPPTPMKLPS